MAVAVSLSAMVAAACSAIETAPKLELAIWAVSVSVDSKQRIVGDGDRVAAGGGAVGDRDLGAGGIAV